MITLFSPSPPYWRSHSNPGVIQCRKGNRLSPLFLYAVLASFSASLSVEALSYSFSFAQLCFQPLDRRPFSRSTMTMREPDKTRPRQFSIQATST